LLAASSHWGLAIDQTLGAETVLAGRGRNARGRTRLALADERPVLALPVVPDARVVSNCFVNYFKCELYYV
jgi:hypothetical protein